MVDSSRFACPTSTLDLNFLLGQLRKTLWLSLGLALLIHLAVVSINPFEQTQAKKARPMTTKFIKREPRLTKPLELRKIPKPKRQMARRRQVRLAAARMDQVQATASFNTRSFIGQVGGFGKIQMARNVEISSFQSGELEPTLAVDVITGTRTAENRIDMNLEMMDVNSMDTGRYRAIVIQDPNDRQALQGFVKFATVVSARSIEFGMGYLNNRYIDEVADALNELTGITAELEGQLTYDDSRTMEVPIIFLRGSAREAPNEAEMEHLAKYLLAGGFIYGVTGNDEVKDFWTTYIEVALEKYGGLMRGKDFWTQRLPEDHPLFSAFFDLKEGAPSGISSGMIGSGKAGLKAWNATTGYFVKGRLVGIYFPWHTGLFNSNIFQADVIRSWQLVVNVIVYVLTQEGSMTQRLMQMVN